MIQQGFLKEKRQTFNQHFHDVFLIGGYVSD
ncbi:hypothetical protein J2S19_000732 [Metabacillus malikii]|uniref:Uncharacterized protein n=1 Tax=Metabacillus malikii TaxID=1504265 RepID=A0ABT9ZB45_9BACI|nr:hypothetical protein [Metabacillus malikii]